MHEEIVEDLSRWIYFNAVKPIFKKTNTNERAVYLQFARFRSGNFKLANKPR